MTKRRILFGNIFPQAPAAAGTDLGISVRRMILISVNGSFCTASICDEDKIIFCKYQSFFHAFYFIFNSRSDFFTVFEVKKNICYFCVKLEINTCVFQIFLHWQDQGFILIVFGEFQSTEIRKTCDMMDKTLEIQLHLKSAVPVFEGKHGSPVKPESGVEYFVIKNVFYFFVIEIFIFC